MPVRILILLLGEAKVMKTERNRALKKAAKGHKMQGVIAFPPIED